MSVPWGVPAIMAALAIPLALWGWSLGIAITEGSAAELSDGEIVFGLVITIVLDLVLIGLAAGMSLRRYRLGWESLGIRAFDLSLWWWPVAAAAAAHLGVLVYSLVLLFLAGEGAVPDQGLNELFDSRAVLPLAGVATVIVAPIAEEIFFRGFIFSGLLRPFGLLGAMAGSGVLFGAFHVTGPDTIGLVVPFGVIGMLFAWLYHRTGSLWPSIATHFLFNLVSFAFLASSVGSILR